MCMLSMEIPVCCVRCAALGRPFRDRPIVIYAQLAGNKLEAKCSVGYVRFEKIAPGRRTRMATGFVAFNALCLLALAALIRAGVFGGDAGLPLIFAIPSFLFLLNSFMGVFEELSPGRQLRR